MEYKTFLPYFKTKHCKQLTYGDDSRMILFACVDEGDRWFANTSLGEVWTTWSTKCPTEDGRKRFLSWVNAELRLNRERAVVDSSKYLEFNPNAWMVQKAFFQNTFTYEIYILIFQLKRSQRS